MDIIQLIREGFRAKNLYQRAFYIRSCYEIKQSVGQAIDTFRPDKKFHTVIKVSLLSCTITTMSGSRELRTFRLRNFKAKFDRIG